MVGRFVGHLDSDSGNVRGDAVCSSSVCRFVCNGKREKNLKKMAKSVLVEIEKEIRYRYDIM